MYICVAFQWLLSALYVRPLPRNFLSCSCTTQGFAVTLRDELIATGRVVAFDLKELGAGQW